MTDTRAPSPPIAVTSIILSMGLVAVGSGLLHSYIPLKLAREGFEPWVAGAVLTVLSLGGLAGCVLTGPLVRRVGHARVFALLAATVTLSILLITLETAPLPWMLSRAIYGFAVAGLFIVSQSWLNDACENQWRGRIIAIFYMTYILGIGSGSFLLRFISLEGPQGPLLGIFFTTLAILPVGLTRLRTPPPPEAVAVAIGAV